MTQSETLATVHSRVSAKLAGFDPATIIAIITALLKLFEMCWPKPEDVKADAANGGSVLQKVMLRRELAREGVPIRDRPEAVKACIEVAAEATVEEVQAFRDCC